MARKEADIKHPREAHPRLIAEKARERGLQRWRDRRVRQGLEKSAACLGGIDPTPAPNAVKEERHSMNVGRGREGKFLVLLRKEQTT
jgi:hypothetical protein